MAERRLNGVDYDALARLKPRVEALAKLSGVTIADLARTVGTPRPTLIAALASKRPLVDVLLAVSDALDVSPGWLVGLPGTEPPAWARKALEGRMGDDPDGDWAGVAADLGVIEVTPEDMRRMVVAKAVRRHGAEGAVRRATGWTGSRATRGRGSRRPSPRRPCAAERLRLSSQPR